MDDYTKNRVDDQMNDTIAAIATPPGRGGVGVIRVSGPGCADICSAIVGRVTAPRVAQYADFLNHDGSMLDAGLAIFFQNPSSFTGEDVLELQGHGGPVILDMLLRRVLSLGARLARAGEFSERAFLNNKMDLVQAEAVAQLISAGTEQAAMAAMRSLQGDFSKLILSLVEDLIRLRLYVEAAIDFPEEEINFLADSHVLTSLNLIINNIFTIISRTQQGVLLDEGVAVVIAGKPNAGKSTLLNQLTGQDTAIVTPIAGTTRDIVRAQINLDGVVLHVLDTAGLRITNDIVEQAGIQRSWQAIDMADLVLLVVDAHSAEEFNLSKHYPELIAALKPTTKLLVVCNKIDQLQTLSQVKTFENYSVVYISAHAGTGMDLLRTKIKEIVGVTSGATDSGAFLARRRHLDALLRAQEYVLTGKQQLEQNAAGELLAEELKHAQIALSEITGEFTSDDLLGRIFSEFCIGK